MSDATKIKGVLGNALLDDALRMMIDFRIKMRIK
jgi:hypothetical protein